MKVIEWTGDRLRMLDQSELPSSTVYLELSDYRDVIGAIKALKVRGAPAIGITAAYGIVLGAMGIREKDDQAFLKTLNSIMDEFSLSRPTAVNLFFAINTLKKAIAGLTAKHSVTDALLKAAGAIHQREELAMTALSKCGAALLKDGDCVLTHCNTGQLATGVSYGTALGVIKAATEQGKRISVYADETRPVLQGARLTAWELMEAGIPVTLITDNMAGFYLNRGVINCVIVGADRIAANGDIANKIGTYGVAVLAHENHVPFYIAAPVSSIDMNIKSGSAITIEERPSGEVTGIRGVNIAPTGVHVNNPAFDVTPFKYIRAIVTEKGIVRKPYLRNLKTIMQEE